MLFSLNSTLTRSELFNNEIPSFLQRCPFSVGALLWAGNEGHTAVECTNPHPADLHSGWRDSPSTINTHPITQGTSQDTQPLLEARHVQASLPRTGPPSPHSHLADPSSHSGTTPPPLPERPQGQTLQIHKGLAPRGYSMKGRPGPGAPSPGGWGRGGVSREARRWGGPQSAET